MITLMFRFILWAHVSSLSKLIGFCLSVIVLKFVGIYLLYIYMASIFVQTWNPSGSPIMDNTYLPLFANF